MRTIKNSAKLSYFIAFLVFVLLIFCTLQGTFAATASADDSGGIIDAINNTPPGTVTANTVYLNPGTYNRTNLDTNLTINKNLRFQGNGTPDEVIIDAQGLSNIFSITTASTIYFTNITFKNGFVNGNGGAISSNASSYLYFINCTFINNQATGSGGAVFSGYYLSITNCTFENNLATRGGAVFSNYTNSYLYLTNTNFTNNRATTYGGGVYFLGYRLDITGAIFEDNVALSGGGIYLNFSSYSYMYNSNFTKNSQGLTFERFPSVYTYTGNTFDSNFIALEYNVNNNPSFTIPSTLFNVNTNSFVNNGFAIGISGYNTTYVMGSNNNYSAGGNGGLIFTNLSLDNAVIESNFIGYTNSWAVYFDSYSMHNYLFDCKITDNLKGVGIGGANNEIIGCTIVNNTVGLVVMPCSVHSKINYNLIFNNTDSNGFDLIDNGFHTDANYNWWGSNTPLTNASLNNWWVMELGVYDDSDVVFTTITNASSYSPTPNVKLSYELVLFDNVTKKTAFNHHNDLPHFDVSLVWSDGETLIEDARGYYSHITPFVSGAEYYIHGILSNENLILNGTDSYVNLTFTKTVNVSALTVSFIDDIVKYNLTIKNNGPIAATNVLVFDVLPLGIIYEDSDGDYNPLTGVWNIGNLYVGETVTLIIEGRVNRTGNLTNSATVYANEYNIGDSTAMAPVYVEGDVTLNIHKDAIVNPTCYGDLVTYTITVSNDNITDATGVYVKDLLDSDHVYVDYRADVGTYDPYTGLWDIGDLPAGETVTLTLYAFIINYNFDERILTRDYWNFFEDYDYKENCIYFVMADNGDFLHCWYIKYWVYDPTGHLLDENRTVNLTINKTVSTNTARNGDTISYTITVVNRGDTTATFVTVDDLLDYHLKYVSHSATAGTHYNPEDSLWFIGNLAPGRTVSLTIYVKIDSDSIPYVDKIYQLNNTAELITEEFNNNTDGNTSTVTTNVTPLANLTIVKEVNASDAYVDAYVNYTFTVTNFGDNATNIIITDGLDSRLNYTNCSSNVEYLGLSSGVHSWKVLSLARGESISFNITVKILSAGDDGIIFNTATVISDESLNQPKRSNIVNTTITSHITINKTVNATEAELDDLLTYVITVTNDGIKRTTDVNVTDKLDPRLTYIDHEASEGTFYNNETGLWTIGDLELNQEVTLIIYVQVNEIGNGIIFNTAYAPGGINSTVNTTFPVPFVNVSVIKTVDYMSSGWFNDYRGMMDPAWVEFKIVVTNNGPLNATGVQVSEVLSGLYFEGADTDNGTYDYYNDIWDIGDLAAGESVILYVYAYRYDYDGYYYFENTAYLTTEEDNIGINQSTVSGEVRIRYDDWYPWEPWGNAWHEMSKTVNATDAVVGDYLTYTITIYAYAAGDFYLPDVGYLTFYDYLDSRLEYINCSLDSMENLPFYSYEISNNIFSINIDYYDLFYYYYYKGQYFYDYYEFTFDITVKINSVGNGIISNRLNTSWWWDYTDSEDVTVVEGLDVTLDKTVNATYADKDDYLNYTITVTNNGEKLDELIITDKLDPNLTYKGFESTHGGSYDENTGFWTIYDLDTGDTATLTISVQIADIGSGIIFNTASIRGKSSTVNTTINGIVNLTTTKTVNATVAYNLDNLTYTITVKNTGYNNATEVNITDVLSPYLKFIGSDPSHGSYDNDTGIWKIGDLAIGDTAILKIYVQIDSHDAPYSNKVFNLVNNITIVSNETNLGLNETNTSTTVYSNVVLDIVKELNTTVAAHGEYITYTFTVSNKGNDDAVDVKVHDILDPRLTYEGCSPNAQLNDTIYNSLGNTYVWSLGLIGPGEYITFEIYAKVSDGDINSYIYNGAYVNDSDRNNGTTNTTVETKIVPGVNLTVDKIVNATFARVGEYLNYTITVFNQPHTVYNKATLFCNENNNGNSYAEVNATYYYKAYNVVVTDILDSRLTDISYTATRGTYDPDTGIWNVGNFTSANETLNIIAYIENEGDSIIYNTAEVPGNNSTVNTTIVNSASVSVNKIVSASIAEVGDYLTYTFTISNQGLDDAHFVFFHDILDSRLDYLGCSLDGEGYDLGYADREFYLNLDLLAAGDSFTFQIYVQILSAGDGIIYNTGEIHLPFSDYNQSNTVNTTIPVDVNLTISKVVNATKVFVGETVQYTITVTNYGPATARDVNVIEHLPQELVYVSHSNAKGTYTPTTHYWSVGNLANGETAILYINVIVNATGNITNRVTVESFDVNVGDGGEDSLVLIDIGEDPSATLINLTDDDDTSIGAETGDEDDGDTTGDDDTGDTPPEDDSPSKASASMKNTGVPVIFVVLVFFLACLGIDLSRDKK